MIKKLSLLMALVTIVFVLLIGWFTPAEAHNDNYICHRTGNGGYVLINPSQSASHLSHNGGLKHGDVYAVDQKCPDDEPEDTIPDTTEPEETVPEDTKPDETVPEDTKPDETVPDTTILQESGIYGVDGSCSSLDVSAADFSGDNTISITLNGVNTTAPFTRYFAMRLPIPQDGTISSWEVSINGIVVSQDSVGPCPEVATTFPPDTPAVTVCDEPGAICEPATVVTPPPYIPNPNYRTCIIPTGELIPDGGWYAVPDGEASDGTIWLTGQGCSRNVIVTTTVAVVSGELPETGGNTLDWIIAAVICTGVGIAIVWAVRRPESIAEDNED